MVIFDVIPAIPATSKACHVTTAHPPTCHLHRGDQVFHSWFSFHNSHNVFFVSFCLIICYSTVLHTHMSTHRDIDTELQRHFLQRPSLMGPLIFLSQHSSDPPVVKILQFLVGEIAVVWWSLDSLDHHDLTTMHWIHWRSDDWVTLWL